MEWGTYVDAYCERLAPGLWAEPLNAVTNAAFLIAAWIMWRRTRGVPIGQVLSTVLVAIGLGSLSFHTLAVGWTGALDSLFILAFVLIFIFAANRDLAGWRAPWAIVGTLAFVPYAIAITPVFDALPFFHISGYYWSLPVLIFGYAVALRRRPNTARGLAVGGAILCASITVRSLDQPLCEAWPIGTHFGWHILNAVMLGWMIEVHRRHMLEARAAER